MPAKRWNEDHPSRKEKEARQCRPDEGTGSIERLTNAVCLAPERLRRNRRNNGVTRRPAKPFADAVGNACSENKRHRIGKCKTGFDSTPSA